MSRLCFAFIDIDSTPKKAHMTQSSLNYELALSSQYHDGQNSWWTIQLSQTDPSHNNVCAHPTAESDISSQKPQHVSRR